jgi:hypothetical protein
MRSRRRFAHASASGSRSAATGDGDRVFLYADTEAAVDKPHSI